MSNKYDIITNAKIFLESQDISFTAKKVTPPLIKYVKEEVASIAMFGKRKVRTGLDALEFKLERTSIPSINIDTSGEVKGKIVGRIKTKEGGTSDSVQVVIWFSGEVAEENPGSAEAGKWEGYELTLDIHQYKMQVGSYVKYDINIDEDKYKADGKDMREF